MAPKPKDKRPKIKLEFSFADKLLEITGWAALYGIWVVAIVYCRNLPDTIPVHFDGLGRPDGYGRKGTFWALPSERLRLPKAKWKDWVYGPCPC